MKRSRLGALAALAALVWVVSHYVPVGADEPQPRIPVPGEQAIAEALKLVRNVYQADYAKKKPTEQVEFAKKLLLAAVDTKDDPTARYVMYCEARDLAIKAGDVNLALDAAGAIGRTYVADPIEMKYVALEAAVKSKACPSNPIVEAALEAANDAVRTDDYAKATRFLKLASIRGSFPVVDARKKLVEEIHKRFEMLDVDRKTLETNPKDSTAACHVGRFLCFIKGDWDAGLPLLAKGDDEKLKELGERELARPGTANDRLGLGDSWWDLAEKLDTIERIEAKARSLHWYQLAAPGLTGLTKARVDKRIVELNKLVGNRIAFAGNDWRVIFRSSNPLIWNTELAKGKDEIAVPLSSVPVGLRYLRMRNVESGKIVIMELPKELPKGGLSVRFEFNGFGWNGTSQVLGNGAHLGIYDMARTTTTIGKVQIWDDVGRATYVGWGFGKLYTSSGGQGYTWDGETIKETVMEIAVRMTGLTVDETKLLLKSKK